MDPLFYGSRGIVAEQLEQVGHAAISSAHKYDWVLKYQSVGESRAMDFKLIKDTCREFVDIFGAKLKCEPLGPHKVQGNEEITLQKMHDFCSKPENKDSLVAYMHNKGSFHANRINHWWRFLLTRAALNSSCLDALLSPTNSCDVCGLQFYPIWTPFFPGNFFSAKCSYVRNLLPVAEHEQKLAEGVRLVEESWGSTWSGLVIPWRDDTVGLGRFSKEHWVTSHPRLKPCDMAMGVTGVYTNVQLMGLPEAIKRLDQSTALPAPRVTAREGHWFRMKLEGLDAATQHSVYQRPHEYFLLPGLLYRHYKQYQEFPPNNSWVWNWFPQGNEWRNKLNQVTMLTSWNESMIW